MSGRRLALVDQGSTSTKAALASSHDPGSISPRSTPTSTRRREGAVEHDPSAIGDDVERLLRDVAHGDRVDGVALACQRSTCLLWTREEGRPLTPALSWQDLSAVDRCAALEPHAALVAERTGLRLSPHYAGAKLARLLDETPEARRLAEAGEIVAGTLDSFLVHRLTGRPTTEPGQAGRTLLFDLDRGDWDDELCDLFGVPRAALPELAPSVGHRGDTETGPLVTLAGDQQAALVGHGGLAAGVVVAHFGTGAFVLASTGERSRRQDGLLTAAVASTSDSAVYQLEGSVSSAGSAIDWATALTGLSLDELGREVLDPESLPWVLPAFAGLAAPWWRSSARAALADLRLATRGPELAAGTLCGVAQRVVDCLEALDEALPDLATLRISGKLTRLGNLVQLLADLAGRPVEVAADEEAGLAGLGRLATLALTGDTESAAAAPRHRSRAEPSWPADRRLRVRSDWRQRVAAFLSSPTSR